MNNFFSQFLILTLQYIGRKIRQCVPVIDINNSITLEQQTIHLVELKLGKKQGAAFDIFFFSDEITACFIYLRKKFLYLAIPMLVLLVRYHH